MVIKAQENLIGAWAFLIGVILAVIVGLVASSWMGSIIIGILAVFGIIVGYFVAEKDVQTFLLASVSLVIVSYTGISGFFIGSTLSGFSIARIISNVLQTLLALFVPATIVVALKTVFSIAKS
jgi:hypothetical protein